MWERILYSILTYLIDKVINLIIKKWDEYKEDEKAKAEIKKKVEALKNAKTKEEVRTAIRNLNF